MTRLLYPVDLAIHVFFSIDTFDKYVDVIQFSFKEVVVIDRIILSAFNHGTAVQYREVKTEISLSGSMQEIMKLFVKSH